MTRVKICGITNLEDALLATEMGADAIGFIFTESPRRITPIKAKAIIHNLPPLVKTVGVFVNEEPARIKEIKSVCGLDLIQLHGDESPEICRDLMPYSIKAFRIQNQRDIKNIKRYQGAVRAILLDTFQKGKAGGTGKTFDWSLAVKAKETGIPVILAGGLGPDNIREAITIVHPYAVDVNSGIEERPGKKDPVLMERLMKKIAEYRIQESEVRRKEK
ncbi:MAG: N-(5'-phosphoribosyl)anthranilate isomerase [Deltaproteobacteria bacterium RBG_13_43_22]|nr:MAG: N-(5'-phosphoribosyl)anthranilate isomerase [Deltaproteobacteria bacterium RBG_13_43_22]